jgi:hypothetical protein
MKYALVEDGLVKESNRMLPRNWKNISNFYLLDQETLKSYGWFPYRFEPASIPENGISDGSYYEITEQEVVEIQTYRIKTELEIEIELDSMWSFIRERRTVKLKECDWTQLSDSPLTPEKKEQWQIYRQSLRDITLQSDPYNIVWPEEPGI